GALAHRFFAGEIDGLPAVLAVLLIVPEVELGLELGRELDDRRKGAAHLAAESLERADHLLLNQLLDFPRLELPARDDLPQREIALRVLALELFVVLMHLAATFRT